MAQIGRRGTVLVTGANGFVGRALCGHLSELGFGTVAASRRPPTEGMSSSGLSWRAIGNLGTDSVDPGLFAGIDAVVHLASRVYVMQQTARSAIDDYRRVNVEGTLQLARAARVAGVRRSVFMSSVKVNGERTGAEPFDEHSCPAPLDPYGISKWEAEQGLREIESTTGLELAILRPPLVYGPGVGANFLRLIKLVDRRIPMPLASVSTSRSLVYVGNLMSAVAALLLAEKTLSAALFVSDGEAMSTPQLIRAIAAAPGKTANLWPFPLPLLATLADIFGRRAELNRLTENLVVNDGPLRNLLSWSPPYGVEEGLRETIGWYSRQP